MSGLCDEPRRQEFSWRQRPFSPWMSPRLCDRPVLAWRRLRCCRASRACGDAGIGAHVALMHHAQRPIDPFFHDHLCCPHVGLDLIELPLVGHGPIAPQDPLREQSINEEKFLLGYNRTLSFWDYRANCINWNSSYRLKISARRSLLISL
jgi:hypothetical protein